MPEQQRKRTLPLIKEQKVGRKIVPVIIGGTFLAYAYIREFHAKYGTTRCIVVLTQDVKMLTTSRFAECHIVEDAAHPEGLYRALEKIGRELHEEDPTLIPLLLGCDDRHALMFSAGKKRLEEAGYLVPCNDLALLETISQKRGFYELCDELSIPHPKTWYFSAGSEGPATLPLDAFPYPCVAKPSDTTKFQNTDVAHKRKAYEIETPAELAQVWQDVRASDYDGDLLIQDFIPGGDEALRILNTFSDAEGNLVAVSGGITALQDHSPTALGNPLCILGEREPAIIECARKFLKRTKYQGYGNFDIKYDARTGEYNFFEINVRAGRSTYFTSLGGIDFVSLVVDQYVLDKQLPYREAYRPFVYNCVPPYVLKRSILDKELLQRVLATLKKTRSPYPLFYTKDSLLHNFWAMTMYYNQIRKFKRYFWDTDGHQYK